MAARLIINADDFGLTRGVNRAIEELYQRGALSSATLMANGPAFDDAVAVARRNPGLGVGCHVVLVDGEPVSPPDSIPTLLGSDGCSFRPSLALFAGAAMLGRLRQDEVRDEALAQIAKIRSAGLTVTHADTHKHAHIFPAVSRALFEALRIASVPAIRKPFEPEWSLRVGGGDLARRVQVRSLRSMQGQFLPSSGVAGERVFTTDGTIGIAATGSLDEATVRSLLKELPDGTWELVCHPGYEDAELHRAGTRLRSQRATERVALLAAVPQMLSRKDSPVFVHYGDLKDGGQDSDRRYGRSGAAAVSTPG